MIGPAFRNMLFSMGFGILIFWIAGYIYFANNIGATKTVTSREKVDAIIVLTGGPDRVNTGFDLLAQEAADNLFISGVHKNVSPEKLYSFWHGEETPPCCVTLGYEAHNTRQNAAETRKWIEDNNIKSAYLVTADYHMPRAWLEFTRALPGLALIPHPVRSGAFPLETILGEYNKTILAWLHLHILAPEENNP